LRNWNGAEMTALDGLLAAVALLGHLALCVAAFNRLHAIGIHRRLRRRLELLLLVGTVAMIAWFAVRWWREGYIVVAYDDAGQIVWPLGYAGLCLVAAASIVPCWLWPRFCYRVPGELIASESNRVDVEQELGRTLPRHRFQARLLSHVPGNEVYRLETNRKTLRLASLPQPLDGLTLTHLSDLHFTGELDRAYFDYVIDAANLLASDVVILSGDILESQECIPWIESTLARLHAPLGVYFVLGNHDKRMPDPAAVRSWLTEIGMIDLGGRCRTVQWRGCNVLLAGNELPWFAAPLESEIQSHSSGNVRFRLLVSHSPDQFPWARRHGFDLMLAGHNHGGQVCLPWLGPLIAPSKHGTRYAAGLFHEPPTLLHVTRGISGEHPIRLNCPPELAQLILRSSEEAIR
jgi:uncharacterized protein